MKNLYRIRQIVQVFTFVLFICFLIYLDPLYEHNKTVNFFVRLSPLSAICTMVAAREFIINFWPALILIISTIILGRYFCSWICPFGTTIDITDKLFAKKRNKKNIKLKTAHNSEHSSKRTFYDNRRLKYYILIFIIIAPIFGVQMVGWLDPLSLATNTYTIVVHPYIVSVIDSIFYLFYDIPIVDIIIKPIHSVFKTVLFSFNPPFFRSHIIFLLIFICIISFGVIYRRYWCRNICPLGTLLALISDWALFKRVVNSKCTSCRRCETECGMGAIDDNGKGTFEGECTLCITCQQICPSTAINFRKNRTKDQTLEIDLSKRKVLTAGIFSIGALPILKLSYFRFSGKKNPEIIRPPGASPENKFVAKCLRCSECMRVCKTNGLHPVVFNGDLADVWTPTLVPRLGYCDYECTLCGRVCPSGAINQLDKKNKQILSIGVAKINHNRCIPWVGFARVSELKEKWEDVNCAVCEEVCPIPIKAIRFDPYVVSQDKEIRRVIVNEHICIGCGFCEKVCPVIGEAAIKVEGIQPQLISKTLKDLKTAPPKELITMFFPESLDTWKREAPPTLYKGGDKLFEYINGGADAYLSYTFIQVAVCVYYMESPRKSIKIDIWEFANSDDAFGIFSKDSTGNVIDLGNEGAIYDNYLWIWNGNYFITIEPQDGYDDILAEDVTALGQSIISIMPVSNSELPSIIDLLPDDGLIKESVIFFHKKINLDNIYISNQFIEENIYILNENTNAVIGEYRVNDENLTIKLMIVKYKNIDKSKKAFQNVLEFRNLQNDKIVNSSDTLKTYIDESNQYYSISLNDQIIVSTFLAPSQHFSEKYINATLKKIRN